MKHFLILIFSILCIGLYSSYAQVSKKYFYAVIGYGAFSGATISPYIPKDWSNDKSFSFLSLYFKGNMLLKEINANKTVSLDIAPGISLSAGNLGYVNANVPITINLNRGLLSSYTSDKRVGLTIGLGVNIQTTSFGRWGPPGDTATVFPKANTMIYIQPCVQFGFRFLNRSGNKNEIVFQTGYWHYKSIVYHYFSSLGSSNPIITPETMLIPDNSFSIRITMIRYF
jgi:hypothetical protein